ncbi:MarR family winged helix-turn-helix transcriptional regulator [Lichenihabitans psoromatis]|uniref:MarR family winged helix-turn-helix transcriptional regulator n=1 Tax=Lichenihabitans psoromatis TaxID=2528642 RepID=UPI0010367884|nr:MarR family transcriptional regulator [Lichenihabitans psoromatis]
MTDAPAELCNCTALRQTARHVTRLYDDALEPVGIGVNQYAVLSRLDKFGPTAIQPLAQALVMDRSTLGHLVRPLEQRRLVSLTVSEQDRRSRLLVLTAEGRALLARARPLWAEAQSRFETTFGAAVASDLRSVLKRVASVDFKTKAARRARQGAGS